MDDSWVRGVQVPLNGRTRIEHFSSWDTAAVYIPELFELSVREIGFADDEVADLLALRDAAAARVRTIDKDEELLLDMAAYYDGGAAVCAEAEVKRRSALERLYDWFRGREFRIDESTESEVRVPLFLLAAASVDGCKATVEHSERDGRALSWNVSFFGSGLGGVSETWTTASWKFSASSGETKVVFIPVKVTVSRVAVLERGKTITTTPWVDASTITTSSEPGLMLLAPDARVPVGKLARTFPLAGDTSGALASYEYKYEQEAGGFIEIGVKALQLEAKLRAGVQMGGAFALGYELQGGYDYELRRLAEGEGLVWSKPPPGI